MEEKRVYQRAPIQLEATYSIDGEETKASIVNISGGGFCIQTKEELPADKGINLNVTLGNDKNASLDLETVWCKKIGDTGNFIIGLRITNPEGEDFDKFLDYYCEKVADLQEEV